MFYNLAFAKTSQFIALTTSTSYNAIFYSIQILLIYYIFIRL